MKKKTAILTISVLCAAIIALSVTAYAQYDRAADYEIYIEANYEHAFGELVTSMSAVDTALQKCLYATSPSMAGAICTEVFGKAQTAQMALSILPFSEIELEQTAGFISKVGDYAFALSRSAAKGNSYTDEERENIKALSNAATILAQNLEQMQSDMSDGYLSMDELSASKERLSEAEEQMEGAPITLSGGMKLVEQEFPEIPTLIYDGPFSEHLSGVTSDLLENEEEVSQDEARRAAASFLGMREAMVYESGTCEGDIPCYYFTAETEGGELMLAISAAGAKPVSMICSAITGEETVSIEDAVKRAADFIKRRGFESMKESYHMKNDGSVTVNYAYEQDGVVCYSDLVKVTVALDTGKVCGFECKGYLMNHKQRELPAVAVNAETAREKVASELEIISENLALVPTEGQNEILCHEFVCQTEDERHYIVYVNAETGEQEKILILLEDDNGSLTI